jgi:hypothetical protein
MKCRTVQTSQRNPFVTRLTGPALILRTGRELDVSEGRECGAGGEPRGSGDAQAGTSI